MKKKYFIIISITLMSFVSLSAQTIVIGSGASIVVPLGADLCAGGIGNIFGNVSGEGTECGSVVSVEAEDEIIPAEFALYQNHPNPFNPATNIKFQLPRQGKVVIKLYDILGSEIITLLNEKKAPGIYIINFNAEHLPSGTYIYRMVTKGFVQVKKMMLLK
jgi:Secretion system C-terminal sorting domain